MSVSEHLARRAAETACVAAETLAGALARLSVSAALSPGLREELEEALGRLRQDLCNDGRLEHTSGLMAEVCEELRALECPEVDHG